MSYTLLDDAPAAPKGKAAFTLLDDESAADPTGSFGQNVAAGMGRVLNRVGLGAKQMGAQAIDALQGGGVRAANVQAEIDEAARLEAPLMRTAGGQTGDVAGNVAMTIPAVLAGPAAAGYAGMATVGGLMGLLQPTQGDESRLMNTAVGGVAGAAGKFAGDKIAGAISGALSNRTAKAAADKAQGTVKDAALAAGREAGYVVPPRMATKQGMLGAMLEGFGGKVKLEQLASNKNAAVTNSLARKELGLAADAPLDPSVLQGIRQQAGQAYDAVASIPQQINWTPEYQQAIQQIKSQFSVLQSKFPTLANKDVDTLVKAMDQGQFSAREAVEFVKAMRQSGNLNANVANTIKNANQTRNLGMAQLKAADAMDDLVQQNLRILGNPQLFDDYLNARVLIAKTHTIENAMDASGNVSARGLLKQLEGKPYGGELKKAADFAGSFPKAVQDVAKVEPYGVTDAGAMALLGAVGGGPAAAIPLARPAARSLVLSDLYQGMATRPKYGVSGSLRVADLIAQNPALRAGLPGGSAGLLLPNAE